MKITSVTIAQDADVLHARQCARNLAQELGFDAQDQARIATAVSEIARNTLQYAGKGAIEFLLEGQAIPQTLRVNAADSGPGIADIERVLNGRVKSANGRGLGIRSARKLMDELSIESEVGRGTRVRMAKALPPHQPELLSEQRLASIGRALSGQEPQNPMDEIRHQNTELAQALDELQRRQDELLRLNRELEDTNRGVLALYAELDEKADHLRLADELKSKFLSHMSHEFRTPLNSILALTHILCEGIDGKLNHEQEKQVNFVKKAANDLLELVNDFLDLAKIEAGKTTIRPVEFEIENLFSALRGMMRPLLISPSMELVFDNADHLPTMFSDEGKVAQILRNFISNSLKFTEHGEVRVSARLSNNKTNVIFSVADTGIGIALEDQPKLFQEFAQLENPLQKRRKGTGLGLPLSKKLAELLGGMVMVQSTRGQGSTFSVTIPLRYDPALASTSVIVAEPLTDNGQIPLLIVVEDAGMILTFQKLLKASPYRGLYARTASDATLMLQHAHPQGMFLALESADENRELLAACKADGAAPLPVLVAGAVEQEAELLALGADEFLTLPVLADALFDALRRRFPESAKKTLLVIDDDEVARYVLRNLLPKGVYKVIEASSGTEGLKLSHAHRVQLILLDLNMPDLRGEDVLNQLKDDPLTRHIPVIIVTSQSLDKPRKDALLSKASMIVSKTLLTKPEIEEAVNRCMASAGEQTEEMAL